ncbi:hypothetical protein PU629_14225 [Pullulanibacillus sp. KACC 23026]|uniref:hypothetical protein n=1 Tax=Pullulanibacillus sp. KACC 23026 TaxID=3028315 RepID=UPI0023B1EFC9|nr:hypothetical protein [Pullulanibacillus sp. KACC 23026]WEG11317.1 hypothetical protein PU629_14225 [Pullulanibacillus sp. KACC 23026]
MNYQPASTVSDLLTQSDLIVEGNFHPAHEKWKLHQVKDGYEFVNTVQFFTIKQVWKGKNLTKIRILLTGLDPLPPAKSPLNNEYPGEFAEGHYVLFLRNIDGTPFFQLTTGMQSVYPVFNNRLISLKGAGGFGELDQLTLKQFGQTLRAYQKKAFNPKSYIEKAVTREMNPSP